MPEPINIMITQGDPAGIGPELVLRSLAQWRRPTDCRVTVIGFASQMAPPVGTEFVQWLTPGPRELDRHVDLGKPSAEGGRAALRCIEAGIDAAMAGQADAIVTAPISKEGLAMAGSEYPGHTELLADRSGSRKVAMLLATAELRVVLATIHEPLAKVPGLLNRKGLTELIELAHDSMPDFGFDRPRIGVAGLNPHAGEAGRFGREEIDIIAPAIADCREKGIDARGPFPGDTLFHRAIEGEFDLVVAMYHDQGLIPIKTLDFWGGVNITLGLPFVRTSPDHGTAYDLAGRGVARLDSFLAALDMAYQLAKRRRARQGSRTGA